MGDRFADLYSDRAHKLKASMIRELLKLVMKPEVISLAGGWPSPDTFPVSESLEIFKDILEENPDYALQYGTSEGLFQLREFLIGWAKEHDGIEMTLDDIIITSGSQQGMELASKVLIDPGDVVLVGLPTYFGGTGAFSSYGAELVGVSLDDQGMRIDILEEKLTTLQKAGKKAKFVYVQPNFHNPAGVTMPLQRRQEMLEIAGRFNLIIVEDNPYGDLRYDGEAVPPLAALDSEGRVIYIRSFSKVFSPGIRMAWVRGEKALIRKMVIARQFIDNCANTPCQYILYEFCRRGYLDRRIQQNIDYYKKKRDFMLDALNRYFPKELTWNRPEGGFFVFFTLPSSMDGKELLEEAIAHNVAFVAGEPFFIDGSGKNTIRFSYAQPSVEEIEKAVKIVAEVIQERLRK